VRARSLRCLARQPVEIIDGTESSCCMYPTPPRTFTSTLRTHLMSVRLNATLGEGRPRLHGYLACSARQMTQFSLEASWKGRRKDQYAH
jgi:hypothetical protein